MDQMDQSAPKWTELDCNVPKMTKLDGLQQTKMLGWCGSKRV